MRPQKKNKAGTRQLQGKLKDKFKEGPGIELLVSAEEKIKEAARRLFTLKGFDAVKTRDIAEEAGINLALLNYYFRSKERLFEIIMLENIGNFFQGVMVIVNEETTDFYKKVELLVDFYITAMLKNPDVPLFVMNEARNNPEKLPISIDLGKSRFMQQFMVESKEGNLTLTNPGHLIVNILGLSIFPFIAKPMMQKIRNITDEEFNALMLERKTLVPQWINAMLQTK